MLSKTDLSAGPQCPQCHSLNPRQARFCLSCGTSLTTAPPLSPGSDDPLIGTVVGQRFQVKRKLGEGGMGVVYEGIQTGIQRPVALKLLHREYARDATLLERFKNEAATASMLTHPNTVTIYDFGKTDNGAPYIAMEYLEGKELSRLIKQIGALPWERVCRIAEQICASLEEAHDHYIIHRDLKPDNVMLLHRGDRDDIVKVLDFGIAKIKTREHQKQLTAAGEIFGTPEYMSPEQIKGEDLTPASDIYSLGVILYHMLTGTLPFNAPSPMALLVKHMADDPPPFSEANSHATVPTELESLVMLSLEKSPEKRPTSMKETRAFLKKVAQTAHQTIQIDASLSRAIHDKSRQITTHSSPHDISGSPDLPVVTGDATPPESPASLTQFSGREAIVPSSGPSSGPSVTIAQEPLPVDAPSQDTSSDKAAIVSQLIAQMKRKRDFPAVSRHISELNGKVNSQKISARQLSNVILKDYSLTSKLLKLINSPYYGQVRGRVTTVSRAVVLMGFDQVRQSALGLLMFDHFCMQHGPQAAALSNTMLISLMSGLAARSLAADVKGINQEEAFICAMMRHLGQNLVAFYFPARFQKIAKKMRREHISEARAATQVLGVTFDELADALAKEWGLPQGIRHTMQPLPDGELDAPRNANERLHHISALANELTHIATHGDMDQRKRDLDRLFTRFAKTIDLDEPKMDPLFQELTEKLADYSEAMNLGLQDNPLIKRVKAWSGQQVSHVPEAMINMVASTMSTAQPLKSLSPRQMARKEQVAREKVLLSGIDEVAAAAARHDDINTVIDMVLETLYRGVKLSKVAFCLYDGKGDTMKAHSGYGDDIEPFLKEFHFRYSRSQDIFSTCLAQGRDVFVDLDVNKGYLSKLPTWYKTLMPELPRQFIIYPVLVKSNTTGILYGDITPKNDRISRKDLTHIPRLRSHLATALKRLPARNRH